MVSLLAQRDICKCHRTDTWPAPHSQLKGTNVFGIVDNVVDVWDIVPVCMRLAGANIVIIPVDLTCSIGLDITNLEKLKNIGAFVTHQ